MKKLFFTLIFAICAIFSFSQTATKAMQVIQNKYLDSLNTLNNVLTYTTSFTTAASGTHTWVAGDAITSSTAASISPTISIPNGIYEILSVEDAFISESNSFPHIIDFLSDTAYVPANSGALAFGSWRWDIIQLMMTMTHIQAPIVNTWMYYGFINFSSNAALTAYANQSKAPYLYVTKNYIAYTLVAMGTLANTTQRVYNLKLRLRKIKDL